MEEKTKEQQCVASLKWILFNIGEDTKPNTFENAIKVYVKNAISIIEKQDESAKFAHLVKAKHVNLKAFCFKDMTAELYNGFWRREGQESLIEEEVAFIHQYMGE